ncbi:hypothetical protein KIN20_021224 [Parelaphostrongylus tenuis]|uniref:Uncharacterized protein n=1 Tax=Parelaphostrongylus tenuis TaxID=148309 RepID=A0AAD5MNL2_PARTN|nr:hypothetical protein KIN20_021224 [Parelaphostrongylus tenuis]
MCFVFLEDFTSTVFKNIRKVHCLAHEDNPVNVEDLLQSVLNQAGNNTSTALRLESENEGVEGLLMSPDSGGPPTNGSVHGASSTRRHASALGLGLVRERKANPKKIMEKCSVRSMRLFRR